MGCICDRPRTRYLRSRPEADGCTGTAALYLDFEGGYMLIRGEVRGGHGTAARTARAEMRHCPLCGRELREDR